MDTPNGGLVRRCFRILSAKNIGLTITLADITEEEFRVLKLIEAERQERINGGRQETPRLAVLLRFTVQDAARKSASASLPYVSLNSFFRTTFTAIRY